MTLLSRTYIYGGQHYMGDVDFDDLPEEVAEALQAKEEEYAQSVERLNIVDQTQSSRLGPHQIRRDRDAEDEMITPHVESDGSDVPTARSAGPRPRPRAAGATAAPSRGSGSSTAGGSDAGNQS